MKKISCVALAMLLLLSSFALTGCNRSPDKDGEQSDSTGVFAKGKTITMIIGVSPGSSNDMILQQWIKIASKYVECDFITDYQTGGSTMVANSYMLNHPADGSYAQLATITNEVAMAVNGVDTEQYEMLATLLKNPAYITVRADSDFYTMQDIIDYAESNPGKLNWAGANSIGIHKFFFDMLSDVAGIEMNYVPYTSTSEVVTSILGKNSQVACGTNAILNYVDSGDLRLIASGTYERTPARMDTPTVYETPGLEASKFGADYVGGTGIMVKSGMPDDAKDAWYDLLAKVSQDEEWIEWAEKQGYTPKSDFVEGDMATESSHARVETYTKIYEQYYT